MSRNTLMEIAQCTAAAAAFTCQMCGRLDHSAGLWALAFVLAKAQAFLLTRAEAKHDRI